MNKIVKDAIIITVITLVSGCLLGLVYEITKEPIATAQYNTQQKAYQTVFEGAGTFEDYEGFDETAAAEVVAQSGYTENTIEGVVAAKDASGATLGYVITVTSHAGYGGDITFSVGIRSDGTVNGYSITSISETAGLGMKAKEEKFYSQFAGKNAEAFEVVKGTASSDNQIEAISGATITSRAVTNGVDAALSYFRTISEGGGANE
ncbi:MAG: RnfABCDGE type electron transport complex subunit G [Lachnospiraceae bacterium]|jgi:electron transport complex protein RnfG|nr:RnfABCDGE type electron transport complex subunit G [Lachnospiraceae bacterium]